VPHQPQEREGLRGQRPQRQLLIGKPGADTKQGRAVIVELACRIGRIQPVS